MINTLLYLVSRTARYVQDPSLLLCTVGIYAFKIVLASFACFEIHSSSFCWHIGYVVIEKTK